MSVLSGGQLAPFQTWGLLKQFSSADTLFFDREILRKTGASLGSVAACGPVASHYFILFQVLFSKYYLFTGMHNPSCSALKDT